MTGYFSTVELNSALSSLSSKLTEKANTANLYPVLKKATSGSEEPTPGYVYQVVIEFSYESSDNSRHLVDYLTKRLQRPSPHGVLKTLKTINHLVLKGSRDFRNSLRENDEYIKNAADYAGQNPAYTGTEVLENVRKLSREILVELFRDDKISEDASTEAERRLPPAISPSGMGSFAGSGGKYEGFGNSPISKGTVTDRVRDMLEGVINQPDPKKQIMALCLEDPVGGYTPLKLPDLPDIKSSRLRTRTLSTSRTLGGWSSSSEDEEAVIEEFSQQQRSDSEGQEARVVRLFLEEDISGLEIVTRIREVVTSITSGDAVTGVFSVFSVLQTEEDEEKLFRALLLLEYLIHKNVMSPNKLHGLYVKVSDRLAKCESNRVADKAEKVSLILTALKSK